MRPASTITITTTTSLPLTCTSLLALYSKKLKLDVWFNTAFVDASPIMTDLQRVDVAHDGSCVLVIPK